MAKNPTLNRDLRLVHENSFRSGAGNSFLENRLAQESISNIDAYDDFNDRMPSPNQAMKGR